MGKTIHLFVVLAFTAASFHEDETFCAFDLFITQSTTLSVLDSKIIGGTVNEFKRGEDLGKVSLDSLVKRKDVLE